jgi:post-segregation antitoxin (ccd killing protein)
MFSIQNALSQSEILMKLTTKSDLARRANCSAATVSRAVKTTLAAAMVNDRVDVDHPAARAFVDKHQRRRSRW